MDESFKIYVLTLKRNQNRIDLYREHCNYFDKVNLVFGIDGKTLDKEEKARISHSLDISSNGVLGCGMSHILTWQNFLDSEEEYAIILEDDTIINMEKFVEYQDAFKELLSNVPLNGRDSTKTTNASMIFLFTDMVGKTKEIEWHESENKEKIKNFRLTSFVLSTGCYLINKEAARKLVAYYTKEGIDYHIDVSISRASKRLGFDNYITQDRDFAYQLPVISSLFNGRNVSKVVSRNFNYSLSLPIVRINDTEINGFILLLFCFFIMIVLLDTYYEVNYYLLSSLYFSVGVFAWDLV